MGSSKVRRERCSFVCKPALPSPAEQPRGAQAVRFRRCLALVCVAGKEKAQSSAQPCPLLPEAAVGCRVGNLPTLGLPQIGAQNLLCSALPHLGFCSLHPLAPRLQGPAGTEAKAPAGERDWRATEVDGDEAVPMR